MHELVYLPTIVDFGVTTEDISFELATMKLINNYKVHSVNLFDNIPLGKRILFYL